MTTPEPVPTELEFVLATLGVFVDSAGQDQPDADLADHLDNWLLEIVRRDGGVDRLIGAWCQVAGWMVRNLVVATDGTPAAIVERLRTDVLPPIG
jgi:hypothetical protein